MGQEPLSRANESSGDYDAWGRAPSWDAINDRAQAWIDPKRTALQIRAANQWQMPAEAAQLAQLDFAHEAREAALQVWREGK